MASYRILRGDVLSNAEFATRVTSVVLEAAPLPDPMMEATAPPEAVETKPAVTQFVPIGIGKPLTVLIRDVYTGVQPKSVFGGGKPMVVVTGLKDYSIFAASSRAVNFLLPDVAPHTRFQTPSVFTDGTNVVAYSPGVLADSLHFTIEFAFDKFPEGLFSTISSALGTLAGIPLLMPAQGYLLAAGTLISTGSTWADALIDGKATFSITDHLDFNVPGVPPPAADFRVLCHFDASGMKYDPGKGLLNRDGTIYAGDEPYVVISVDGAERKGLASFTPTVATSAILKQFFNMRDGAQASAQVVVDGLKLVSDMKYRTDAMDLQTQVSAEKDADEKKKLQDRLEATLKNITNAELKKLPGGTT